MTIQKSAKAFVFLLAAAASGLALEAAPNVPSLRRNFQRSNRSAPAPAPVPAAAASATGGAQGEKPEMKAAPALNWEGAPASIILQAYADQVGKTMLIDPGTDTKKQITLKSREGQKLSEPEYLEAIEVVLEMNGIHIETYGKSFLKAMPRKIMRKEGVPLILGETAFDDKDKVVSTIIRFKDISADTGEKILKEFLSDKANPMQVFKHTNSILVTDTMQNINRMREILKEVDRRLPAQKPDGEWFPVVLAHATAANVEKALQAAYEYDKKRVAELNSALEKQEAASAGARNAAPQQPSRPLFINGKITTPQPAAAGSSVVGSSPFYTGMLPTPPLFLFDADNAPNKLIVYTTAEEMKIYRQIIEQLDVPSVPDKVVKVYRLKYAEAEEVADMITDLINKASGSRSSGSDKKVTEPGKTTYSPTPRPAAAKTAGGDAKIGELTPDNTQVLADKRINGLVVQTMRSLVPTIEQIIESMDVKLSQVLIETAIIEVTLGKNLNTGVDWVQNAATGTDPTARVGGGGGSNAGVLSTMSSSKTYAEWYAEAKEAIGSSATETQIATYISEAKKALENGSSVSPIGSGINLLFKSDRLNLSAVVTAAKTDARSKYIASPIVMTVDNKEATINATDMTYLLKGFTSSGNSYSTIAVPDYEQKELGIEIKTTPKINPNGTVMLTVETKYTQKGAEQTIKYSTGNSSSGSSSLQDVSVPTTSTREMSADVLLENMQTVVLGGLTDTYTSESETGIPILKDIPWIGKWLFGKVIKEDTRKELLIFMTPYVMDDSAAAQTEAIRRKKALSDARPWDDHGWSLSELADPVSKREQLRRLKDEWAKQDEERKAKLAIEGEKVERAKALEKMTDDERKFWLEQHKDELEKEAQQALEAKMLDKDSQAELRKLAEDIRARKLREAEQEIHRSDEAEKQKNERGKLGDALPAAPVGPAAAGPAAKPDPETSK